MTGAKRPRVIDAVTGFDGSTGWPPLVVRVASVMVIVPATVPTWIAGNVTGAVELAGM